MSALWAAVLEQAYGPIVSAAAQPSNGKEDQHYIPCFGSAAILHAKASALENFFDNKSPQHTNERGAGGVEESHSWTGLAAFTYQPCPNNLCKTGHFNIIFFILGSHMTPQRDTLLRNTGLFKYLNATAIFNCNSKK